MSEAVIAIPCDMPEGYTFQAVVDGRQIPVTIPSGGVKQGQELRIPVKTTPGVQGEPVALAVPANSEIPTGAWRHGLCDCGDVCCSGLWWFACCCPSLVNGQMLSRMNLDWSGSLASSPEKAQNAFTVVLVCFLVCLFGNGIIPGLGLAFLVYFLIYSIKLRAYMRSKYKIRGSCCDGGMDDCCCVFWCTCCTSIQMVRQTHDDGQYDCCTFNGLRPGVPTVV